MKGVVLPFDFELRANVRALRAKDRGVELFECWMHHANERKATLRLGDGNDELEAKKDLLEYDRDILDICDRLYPFVGARPKAREFLIEAIEARFYILRFSKTGGMVLELDGFKDLNAALLPGFMSAQQKGGKKSRRKRSEDNKDQFTIQDGLPGMEGIMNQEGDKATALGRRIISICDEDDTFTPDEGFAVLCVERIRDMEPEDIDSACASLANLELGKPRADHAIRSLKGWV